MLMLCYKSLFNECTKLVWVCAVQANCTYVYKLMSWAIPAPSVQHAAIWRLVVLEFWNTSAIIVQSSKMYSRCPHPPLWKYRLMYNNTCYEGKCLNVHPLWQEIVRWSKAGSSHDTQATKEKSMQLEKQISTSKSLNGSMQWDYKMGKKEYHWLMTALCITVSRIKVPTLGTWWPNELWREWHQEAPHDSEFPLDVVFEFYIGEAASCLTMRFLSAGMKFILWLIHSFNVDKWHFKSTGAKFACNMKWEHGTWSLGHGLMFSELLFYGLLIRLLCLFNQLYPSLTIPGNICTKPLKILQNL